MTILLILCLVATLLPTAALASEAASIKVTSGELTAGEEVSSITLGATGATFADNPTGSISLSGEGQGTLQVSSVTASAGDSTATLNVSGKPKQGILTITAQASAFQDGGQELTTTVTVNAPSVSVTASGELTQGTAGGSIQLRSTGSPFKAGDRIGDITIEGGGTPAVTAATSDGSEQLTLTMAAPTTTDPITVKIAASAFEYPPTMPVTASPNITIKAPTVSAEVSGGPLTVGQQGTFTVEATGSAFAADLSTASYFTLSGGVTGAPTSVAADGNTATLTVTPTTASPITVTSIDKAAFQYQPDGPVTGGSITGSVTVYAAAPTVTASGTLTAGSPGQITLTIDGDNTFASNVDKSYFTLDGGATGNPTNIGTGGNASITLDVTPTAAQNINISIAPEAFTSKPEHNATCNISVGPAAAPTVNASGTLTAGVANGQITLTIDGGTNTFASTLQAGWFTLTTDNGDKLTVTGTPSGGTGTTLTVAEAPTKAGKVTGITIEQQAFTYQPASKVTTNTNNVTIDPATVEMIQPAAIIAGNDKEIKLVLTQGTFADLLKNEYFTVSGDGVELSSVKRDDDQNATLTLTAAPAETGNITVTALVTAFKFQPSAQVQKTVEVQAPSGTIAATQSGTLIAGTAASNVTVALEITGSLNFKQPPDAGDFTLGDGATGLTVSKVAYTDGKNVTLTLSGTPKSQGTFQVKVGTSAFVVKPTPTPGETITAAGDITAAYPTITLTAEPYHIVEDTVVETITLTAEGSVFNAVDQTGTVDNFSISFDGTGEGTIALDSVKSSGDNKATLTISGKQETPGKLTITVKPEAFKYKPESDVTKEITIDKPTGDLSAQLNGNALYVGTPVSGTTIVVEIKNSVGLHFTESLDTSAFQLTGDAMGGLKIETATWKDATTATLTLSGTPETAGKFQVQAIKDKAFHAAPNDNITATGEITVNAAPDVTVQADPDGPLLYAGTPADGTSVFLGITSDNTAFAATPNKANFTLTGDFAGLTIADAKLSDGKIVLTLSGTPTTEGTFSVQIDPAAFTIRPESAVTASPAIVVHGANVKLTVTDNKLQAGVENGTVTLTLTGSKFADGLDASKITPTGGNDFKDLKLGGVKVDGSTVTLTVTGKPAVAGNITLTFAPDAFVPAPDEAVTVAVPVAKGAQTETTDSDTGSEEAAVFGTNVSDLAAAILGEEDKALFDKGAKVEFELNVDNETQVDEGDKTQVETVSTAGGYTVGAYLDVTLSYTVNGGSPVDVSNTKTPIKVVFPIPASIQADGREYAVVRVHDGKAEIIAGPVTGTTITVSTDKFSTYAIIYRVAPAGSDSGTGTAGKTAPNTGDGADLALWTGALALGLTGLAAVLAKRKKRSR